MIFEGGAPVACISIGADSAFKTLTGLKNVTGGRASGGGRGSKPEQQ
ncbi:MAG: hypothetical protein LLG06_20515 [Desulfobacteraceae bacterium]|nr:hypothetical protein [Desulfobacteraceae bacterium]